jgi:hypothetical protein
VKDAEETEQNLTEFEIIYIFKLLLISNHPCSLKSDHQSTFVLPAFWLRLIKQSLAVYCFSFATANKYQFY